MRRLRSLCLLLAVLAGPAVAPRAQAGEIRFTHRYWNNTWWTDIWDVEFPNIWTRLGTVSGYYESPW